MLAPNREFIIDGDDPSVSEFAVRFDLIEAINDAGSVEAYAKLHGLDEIYLSEAVKGQTILSAKLLNALGYYKVTRYRRRVES